MSKPVSIRVALLSVALLLAGACGDSPPGPVGTLTPEPDTTTTITPGPTPTPGVPLTQLRVAYLNLLSPIEVDVNDQAPEQTYAARLQIAVDELKRAGVDIVGFSEVTWTRELETPAWSILSQGLQMEGSLVARANPWFPGQTREQSDATRDSIGFEEGEYLLSRYPILSSKRYPLNPRTSESEGRAVLHAVIAVPEPAGDLSVYVTRLSGDESTRKGQEEDLARIIAETREGRPVLILADLASTPDTPVVQDLVARGYDDAGAATDLPTCCRESILLNVPGATPSTSPSPGAGETPSGDGAETPEAAPTSTALLLRTDYIFSWDWQVASFALIARNAVAGADGSTLYASDHAGIIAVFDLAEAEE